MGSRELAHDPQKFRVYFVYANNWVKENNLRREFGRDRVTCKVVKFCRRTKYIIFYHSRSHIVNLYYQCARKTGQLL